MKIKSLNWRPYEPSPFYKRAEPVEIGKWEGFGLGHYYEIYKLKTRWRVWLYNNNNASYFKDIDSAQKACQKEFEKRVKEWIE